MQYILASQSPRRRELLSFILPTFEVCPANIDERLQDGAPLTSEIVRLAAAKALTVSAKHPDALVIGSDTMVTIDGQILGKPKDAQDARRMLRLLSGRTHQVLTGAAAAQNGRVKTVLNTTEVTFRTLQEDEIEQYIATGEPFDKAGAYGIQGHGALLVRSICGDYYSVMGLPVAQLYEILSGKI